MSRGDELRLPFEQMMQLEAHGPDTFVGTGPRYPWEGLYGGQVVAQALRAAQLTVKDGYEPHSLHANFLRLGEAEEPVRYEVERLRDGRSFFAREIVARQSTGAILNMSASFRRVEAPATDVQVARAPRVAPPEQGKPVSWSPLFELRHVEAVAEPAESDSGAEHHVGGGAKGRGEEDAGGGANPGRAGGGANRSGGTSEEARVDRRSAFSWFRVLEDLGPTRTAHAAALAFVSDSGPAWLVAALHEAACAPRAPWRPLSLDHTIWFHRPFRADNWLLLQAFTDSLYNSAGLATGRIFSREGFLVASIAQEVLLRRPPSGGA